MLQMPSIAQSSPINMSYEGAHVSEHSRKILLDPNSMHYSPFGVSMTTNS